MSKRLLSAFLAFFLAFSLMAALPGEAEAAARSTGTGRALIIGCGVYAQSSANLDPSPRNDALSMVAVFERDPRFFKIYGYSDLSLSSNVITAGDSLMGSEAFSLTDLITKAYAGAQSNDISVFFFSGHGANINNDASIMMSDMQYFSARELRAALDKVPGTKVIILDCCYSGAAISKGDKAMESFNESFIRAFSTPSARGSLNSLDYYVLTASSQNELSWGDTLEDSDRPMGLFTEALASALGDEWKNNFRTGGDNNLDGTVTLKEAFDYTRNNNIFSRAQAYPENSDFPLYQYTATAKTVPQVVNLSMKATSGGAPYIANFRATSAFTGSVSIHKLQFTQLSASSVSADFSVIATLHNGAIPAGQQTYSWNGAESAAGNEGDDYYLCVTDTTNNTTTMIPFTANSKGYPIITLTAPNRFEIEGTEEMCIQVGYNTRCSIDVQIIGPSGETIRTLANGDPAVPEGRSEGSGAININKYYWDGKNDSGEYVSAGDFALRVRGYNASAELDWTSQPLTVTGGISLENLSINANPFNPEMQQLQASFTADDGEASYTITDAAGSLIYTSPAYPVGVGTNAVAWNGKNSSGAYVAEGLYNFNLTLTKGALRVSRSLSVELQRTGAASLSGTLPEDWSLSRTGLALSWNSTARGDTTISLANASGSTVYTHTQVGNFGANSFKWNGLLASNSYIADGTYTLKIALTKSGGETAELTQSIRIYKFPEIISYKLANAKQSAKSAIQVQVELDGPTRIQLRVKKNNTVLLTRNSYAATAGENTINWTLKDSDGKYLEAGKYTVSLTMEYGEHISKEYTMTITLQ